MEAVLHEQEVVYLLKRIQGGHSRRVSIIQQEYRDVQLLLIISVKVHKLKLYFRDSAPNMASKLNRFITFPKSNYKCNNID